jgi:hypothetical protein
LVAVFTWLGAERQRHDSRDDPGVLFQAVAGEGAERLVMVLQKTSVIEFPHGHSWLDYRDYRERVSEFEDVLALFFTPVHLSVPGRKRNAPGSRR